MDNKMKIGICTTIAAYVLSIVGVIFINDSLTDELKK